MKKSSEYQMSSLSPEKRQALLNLLSHKRVNSLSSRSITPLERLKEINSFPASFSQRRLWFINQLKPDSIEYNIPFAYKIKGKLDVKILEKSILEIMKRHEIWRTCFQEADGEPIQVVYEKATNNIQYYDLRNLKEDQKEEKAFKIAREASHFIFNLKENPLIKFTLICKSDTEYILVIVAHHIVIDSWSIDIFKKELTVLYEAMSKNEEAILPVLKIQYADYAVWQKGQLEESIIKNKVEYWRSKLHDKMETLNMPTDYTRPSIRSFNGQAYYFTLSKPLSDTVIKTAVSNRCTPFMLLLAVYQVLFYRYTYQERIVVGSSISTRQSKETEDLIGFFVNNLVFNSKIESELSFKDYLQTVKEEVLNAYEHQEVPFERLVEELRPERDLSRTPIFQVMFNYLNVPNSHSEIKGLQLEPFGLGGSKASVDIDLFGWESEGIIHFNLEYNTTLFKQDTIMRLSKQYVTLLESVTEALEMPIGRLDLLSEQEKDTFLYKNHLTLEKGTQGVNFHTLFEKQVERIPESIAISFEGTGITYRQLNERANQLAHFLISIGIAEGKKIGLFMDRSIEMVVSIIAVLKSGACYIPLDPIYPKERIEKIVENAQLLTVLAQRVLLADFPIKTTIKLLCIETLLQDISSYSLENPRLALNDEAPMYIIFTSGSSGEPKGVVVEHRNYSSYLINIIDRLRVDRPLSFAMVSTFAADLGTTNLFVPLATGGSTHIISYECSTDPEKFSDYFRKNSIDVMKLVPSHFEALYHIQNPEDIIPNRMIIFAGEPCKWEIVESIKRLKPNCRILNNYGPTETTVSVLAHEVNLADDNVGKGYVPLGVPLSHVYVYVLDQYMQLVPKGITGELFIGGESVARGYLGKESLTAEKFIENPFIGEPARRLYRTGDQVRYLDNGAIEFIGRIDRQVKIRGYRVEPEGIEYVLKSYHLIHEAIVTTFEDELLDKRLVAYLVLTQRQETFKSNEVKRYLKTRLPDYMIPAFFVLLKEIPLNSNGKINYTALPLPYRHREEAEDDYTEPRNQLEKELTHIWGEILGVSKVGIDDNFFDLGGESFKAIKAVRKIGKQVSVIELFRYPTIRQLADRLNDTATVVQEGRLIELTKADGKEKWINLICFPFAGASAIAFQPLADVLPNNCSLYAVKLPGHDFSVPNDIHIPLELLANECLEEIKIKVKGPIAIYAQCVSGALGLRLAYLLEQEGVKIISLFEAANFPSPRLPGKIFELWSKIVPADRWISNRVYRETLRSIGNSDETENGKEEDFIINGIRYEARQAENYFSSHYYRKDLIPLKCPICCIIGERDRTTEFYEERYHEWEKFSHCVKLKTIENAGHFFQKYQARELSGIIIEEIISVLQPESMSDVVPELTKQEEKMVYNSSADAHLSTQSPSISLFLFIILGQIISIVGSNLSGFALGVWIYQKTGSITQFSLISLCALLPSILLAPIGGAIADRWDKRKIMIGSDVFGILGSLLVFCMFLLGNLQVWHICIAAALGSIGATFQRPAFLSAIPQIVPKQYIGQANGIIQLGMSGGEMLGPILGGLLIVILGLKGIILLDVISCLVSVATLCLVRFPKVLFKKREEPFIKELIGGWRYIAKRRSFVIMIIFFVVSNFLMSMVTVLFTPLATTFTSTKVLGIVLAANAAGVLIGSMVMSLWGGTKRRADGMVGYVILTGLSIIVAGIRPSPIWVGLGLFLFGFSVAFIDTHWQILIQSKVGLELQGRVFSINQMLVFAMRPLAFLMAGPICEKILKPFIQNNNVFTKITSRLVGAGEGREMGLFFLIIGGILTIWGYLGFCFRPLRYMEDVLPDAIPGSIILKDKDKMQALAEKEVRNRPIDSQVGETKNITTTMN